MALFELIVAYGMTGLLAISLTSSIIPIPTEPMVLELLRVGKNPEIILVTLIAGSIIGSVLGYLLGKYELRKIIPFHDKEKEKKMQIQFRRYGAALLLVSPWIPFLGDLAPMVAGVENYDSKRFLTVISTAKIFKSIAIVYLSYMVVNWWTMVIK